MFFSPATFFSAAPRPVASQTVAIRNVTKNEDYFCSRFGARRPDLTICRQNFSPVGPSLFLRRWRNETNSIRNINTRLHLVAPCANWNCGPEKSRALFFINCFQTLRLGDIVLTSFFIQFRLPVDQCSLCHIDKHCCLCILVQVQYWARFTELLHLWCIYSTSLQYVFIWNHDRWTKTRQLT